MSPSNDWLILVSTLPARNTAARMRVWRAIKTLGCATLRDGVYLLPLTEATDTALRTLASEVRAASGSAEVLHITADVTQTASFHSLFDRSEDYGRLLATIRAALGAPDTKAAHALRREFNAIAATDHFPGEARQQVEAALAELSAIASGEPRPGQATIRRLASADFAGRTWATRRNIWVDRMASAWLIRRFIDRKAKFLWLENPKKCPKDALGFDFDGAAFTHVGDRVSFEVLAVSFRLDTDPAIAKIGAIIHYLDVGGASVAEAAGIEAVLAGLRAAAPNDDKLLTEASRVFDGLYKNYQQENHHE
ncbi:MAG: chromate resistance protein [Rhodocyclaceae bacterium]|nr:chromate resistance protein [Rhodocyclaceae bacterium]